MNSADTSKAFFRKTFIIVLLLAALAAFVLLIRHMVTTVILAAMLGGLLHPLQNKLTELLKGRRTGAAVITIILTLLFIGVPLLGVLAVAAKEAADASQLITPWLQEQMKKPPEQWMNFLNGIPFVEELQQYQSGLVEGVSKLLQNIGAHLTGLITAITTGTIEFLFRAFVGIYSLFFFLIYGDRMMKTAFEYLPLTEKESREIIQKGAAIIRATVKSLFVIGTVQGGLVTAAFLLLGIKAAVFWGILVAVLSAIPGLGAPIIWVPASIYLALSERFWAGIGLAVWGVAVVGLADNFLRPLIIGKEAKVPELLILLSILGGLATFGISGIILGPILAGVLISILEIYSKVFHPILKE